MSEILDFGEESQVVENYFNKGSESMKKNFEYHYCFMSKISPNWYFGFYAINFRGNNPDIMYKIENFIHVWRNCDIHNFQQRWKNGEI